MQERIRERSNGRELVMVAICLLVRERLRVIDIGNCKKSDGCQ